MILCGTILFATADTCVAAVDSALVAAAQTYLNNITGLAGDFMQTANGKKANGTFSLFRPGRVRLDYKNQPVQLISDGDDLYFYDRDLDQITTVPMESTPAGIIARKNIKLSGADIIVSDTNADKNTFSMTMHIKDADGLGNMRVVFNRDPVALRAWTVTDASGNKTDVKFSELKTKTDFPKNFFSVPKKQGRAGDEYYN